MTVNKRKTCLTVIATIAWLAFGGAAVADVESVVKGVRRLS